MFSEFFGAIVLRNETTIGTEDGERIVEALVKSDPGCGEENGYEKWRARIPTSGPVRLLWYASPLPEDVVEDWFYKSDYPLEEARSLYVEDTVFYDPRDRSIKTPGKFYKKLITIENGAGELEYWTYEWSDINGKESGISKMDRWRGEHVTDKHHNIPDVRFDRLMWFDSAAPMFYEEPAL